MDEAPVKSKLAYVALHKTLQGIQENQRPFGGIPVIFGALSDNLACCMWWYT